MPSMIIDPNLILSDVVANFDQSNIKEKKKPQSDISQFSQSYLIVDLTPDLS